MRQRITDTLPPPDGLQGKGIRDLPNERAISLDLKIKSGTNRMPRQTDTAEPFPRRDDTHATSRRRNDTLTSLPSMPLIPTSKRPVFRETKQRRRPAGSAETPTPAPARPGVSYGTRLSPLFLNLCPCVPVQDRLYPASRKRTVRTTETEPRYIHLTLSVICRTPDKIQNQTYGKSSGVRIRRRCFFRRFGSVFYQVFGK